MADQVSIEDLVVGTGKKADDNTLVKVKYTAKLSTGSEIVGALAAGETVEMPFGAEIMIEGWNKGLEGMRVGGKRKVTIPAGLAYGATGLGDIVPPNSALVFEVELIDVRDLPT
jgi:FKBP-type peptidyl-prolyl cis-trans isomerase